MPTQTIPINKKRFPYSAIVFSGMSAYFISELVRGTIEGQPMSDPVEFADYIFLALFLLYALRSWADYLHNVFGKNAGITILDDGIDDQSSIYSLGKITWEDISAVEIKTKLGIDLLFIYLHDPKAHLSAQPLWKRVTLRRWLRRFGAVVIISQRRFTYSLRELKTLLKGHSQ